MQFANCKGRANLCGISVGQGILSALSRGGQLEREQLVRADCTTNTLSACKVPDWLLK